MRKKKVQKSNKPPTLCIYIEAFICISRVTKQKLPKLFRIVENFENTKKIDIFYYSV